jgi:hypothetical protein
MSISAIETILRYVYYVRNEDEWTDVVDILRQSEPLIRETAMTTIAEMLILVIPAGFKRESRGVERRAGFRPKARRNDGGGCQEWHSGQSFGNDGQFVHLLCGCVLRFDRRLTCDPVLRRDESGWER